MIPEEDERVTGWIHTRMKLLFPDCVPLKENDNNNDDGDDDEADNGKQGKCGGEGGKEAEEGRAEPSSSAGTGTMHGSRTWHWTTRAQHKKRAREEKKERRKLEEPGSARDISNDTMQTHAQSNNMLTLSTPLMNAMSINEGNVTPAALNTMSISDTPMHLTLARGMKMAGDASPPPTTTNTSPTVIASPVMTTSAVPAGAVEITLPSIMPLPPASPNPHIDDGTVRPPHPFDVPIMQLCACIQNLFMYASATPGQPWTYVPRPYAEDEEIKYEQLVMVNGERELVTAKWDNHEREGLMSLDCPVDLAALPEEAQMWEATCIKIILKGGNNTMNMQAIGIFLRKWWNHLFLTVISIAFAVAISLLQGQIKKLKGGSK
ncbi:hypothetical protein DACRYDRAFT_15932 [Dacryopinax primogenitus]|uniref:Uncharacterized protein n=1 Tax=Dacryopinax primogenitus (strain DJM 731) TaxID=1858805 RepID=M5FZN6_DACPD|nr:uncharacterized protein DACRYDRAFT_15932 [Dacryopinax primogenitus]EJU01974.1 hypothetical protein DACRYDRAFT_15932 [Dacryopinax primogenitus]